MASLFVNGSTVGVRYGAPTMNALPPLSQVLPLSLLKSRTESQPAVYPPAANIPSIQTGQAPIPSTLLSTLASTAGARSSMDRDTWALEMSKSTGNGVLGATRQSGYENHSRFSRSTPDTTMNELGDVVLGEYSTTVDNLSSGQQEAWQAAVEQLTSNMQQKTSSGITMPTSTGLQPRVLQARGGHATAHGHHNAVSGTVTTTNSYSHQQLDQQAAFGHLSTDHHGVSLPNSKDQLYDLAASGFAGNANNFPSGSGFQQRHLGNQMEAPLDRAWASLSPTPIKEWGDGPLPFGQPRHQHGNLSGNSYPDPNIQGIPQGYGSSTHQQPPAFALGNIGFRPEAYPTLQTMEQLPQTMTAYLPAQASSIGNVPPGSYHSIQQHSQASTQSIYQQPPASAMASTAQRPQSYQPASQYPHYSESTFPRY